MKTTLLLLVHLVLVFPTLAQEDNGDSNPIQATRQGFGEYQGLNMNVGFVNPKARIEGSAYYFDNWDSEALIYLKEQGRYKIEKVNINLYDNTLDALYDDDNVFTFDTENLLQIVINKTIFRPLIYEKELKLFELFYNDGLTIYKNYLIGYSNSSPNPMVNRRTNKYTKNERFFLYRDNQLIKIKLTKKAFAKLFKTDALSQEAIVSYISDNNLSLKKDDDLIQVLHFVSN